MSGHFGGQVLEAPNQCVCGRDIPEWLQMCHRCWELYGTHIPVQKENLKPCRYCSRAYTISKVSYFCSPECATAWDLKQYHSERAVYWFHNGWALWAIEILSEALREMHPTPLIEVRTQPVFNVLDVPSLSPVDGKTPATRKAVGRARPPRRDNVCNAVTHVPELASVAEDLNEKAWNWVDRR